ncbi:MAG: helicase-related protein [bacterium]
MLIDNKTEYSNGQPKTVAQYLEENLTDGNFKLVSGYYSLQTLSTLLDHLDRYESIQLLLGYLTENSANLDIFALKNETLSIKNTLKFSIEIPKILDFIEQPKVEIKTKHPDFCHAKMYLARNKNEYKKNFAISGSSNFTPSGLGQIPTSNIELNHEFKDKSAIDELEIWFDNIYSEAKDNKIEVIEQIRNYFKQEYLPSEIYDKIIYHLFLNEFEASKDVFDQIEQNKNLTESVVWNKLYDFQKKGVVGLIQRLEKYNFALLGDGVGLGKTWQTLAVIKYCLTKGEKVLVISPKKLEQNWLKYQFNFKDESAIFYEDELNFEFLPMSQLVDKFNKNGDIINQKQKFDNFDLIVIDESHNLRNDKTESYKYLVDKILKGRKNSKVLLLSATPLNNKVTDVRNQFGLGFKHDQNRFDSHFDFDLERSFSKLQEVLNKAQKDKLNNQQTVQNISQQTKFLELVNGLCVARTRSVISKFYPESQIRFPTAKIEWQPLEIFEKAVEILMDKDKPRISFNIYKISKYLSKDEKAKLESGSVLDNEIQREGFLSKMMMINLIKRLESSVYAFDKTLSRIIQYHNYILKLDEIYSNYKKNPQTFSADSLWPGGDQDIIEFISDESEEIDSLLLDMSNFGKNIKDQIKNLKENPSLIANGYLIGGKKQVNINELGSSKRYINNVASEKKKLEEIQQQMHQEYGFDELDMKIVRLKQIVKSKLEQNPEQKILIFTTYADTAEYIYKNLVNSDFIESGKLAKVTGSSSKIDQTLKQFSPESMLYNELNKSEKEKFTNFNDFWNNYNGVEKTNPIQILIGTDCISEGQNLQDCDFLINFDIHWNPVRLVQRNGRIDRIGSKFETVNIKNFLPGKSLEDVLKIKSRLDYKMALVGMVGGVDTDPVLDQDTQEIVNFWQSHAQSQNRDLSEFTQDEVSELVAGVQEPKKYQKIFDQITSNTLADYRELEMLKLMETNYDELEEQELGIKNFSLDQYQLELSNILVERSGLKHYPNGIYSGVAGDVDSVILLLKNKINLKEKELENYKKSNAKHPYLMYQIALNGQIIKRYTQLPQILEYLKALKNKDRQIATANEPKDNLENYENIIKLAISNYKNDFEGKELSNLLSGGTLSSNKSFSMDDFELITWMIVSKE